MKTISQDDTDHIMECFVSRRMQQAAAARKQARAEGGPGGLAAGITILVSFGIALGVAVGFIVWGAR